MKTKMIFSLLFLVLTSCAGSNSTPVVSDVLIIGDSVSIAYTPYAQKELPDLKIVHNYDNARNSDHGVNMIDTWLNQSPTWKLVTFNHGIWDMSDSWLVSIPQYKKNLRAIGLKIKARSEKVIFFTTTHIPVNEPYTQGRNVADLNNAAIEVMNEIGIPVYDLNAVSNTITHLHRNGPAQDDVHWDPAGSEILGKFVADSIANELGN